jgi:hypothetical protein
LFVDGGRESSPWRLLTISLAINHQLSTIHPGLAKIEKTLFHYGAWIVMLVAIAYYGSYYRSGLPLAGEGGTVAVVAMRLMEGQRPLMDTFLGYNLMWFYPVVWLFQLTGPNYIALKIFFFSLCTFTSVLAFFTVRKISRTGSFAFLVALGPLLIPGMMFRNYMGFLAVLNMFCLLQAYVFEQPGRWRQLVWMALAGIALGITYLVRIDLGTFFTLILLGLAVLFCFGKRGEGGSRFRLAAAGLVLTALLFVATHAPFYFDAVRRGYAQEFVAQYSGWLGMVRYLASHQIAKSPPQLSLEATDNPPSDKPSPPSQSSPDASPPSQSSPDASSPSESPPDPSSPSESPADPSSPSESFFNPSPAVASDENAHPGKEVEAGDLDARDYLQKSPLSQLMGTETFRDKAFIVITYLPVPLATLILLASGFVFLAAFWRRDFALRTEALAVIIVTGSALTVFPQYFFFRPDTPHLSEFMVPFMIALSCAGWTFVRWSRAGVIAWIFTGVFLGAAVAHVALYFYHSFPKESAGTIAARSKRKYELVAENGVRVFLKYREQQELQKLCEVIKAHTQAGDYLVTYPYSPTVNFMTDRRSYEYNLYVDNAYNVSGFHTETLREVEGYRPAAIIIDNRAINKAEASRFKNWAPETYDWVREHYAYAGTFRRQEVYLRPDLYNGEK